VVSYILLVAVLNVFLGFGVGAYLGRRYQSLAAAGGYWGSEAMLARLSGTASLDRPAAPPSAGNPPADEVVQPTFAFEGDGEEIACRELLDEFKVEVQQYQQDLSAADDQLRTYADDPEAGTVKECLESLSQATDKYLEDRGRVCADLQELSHEYPRLGAISGNLQEAVRQQDAEIENVNQIIESCDGEFDPGEVSRKMVDQTNNLTEINHHLRDTIDDATAQVDRRRRPPESEEQQAPIDELTGVMSRPGAEAELGRWWQHGPQAERKMSVALIDVDEFGQINERFGEKTGNKMLRSIAQFLEAEKRGEVTIARYSGQRFLCLLPDADARTATNVVERFRQGIAMVGFQHGDATIRITVSCAVSEAAPEDDSGTLLERVDTTLAEAKRYGRNRTFLHEGTYPTPVVPPNFSLQAKQVAL